MEEKIRALKAKLQGFNTRELLGIIANHFITFGNTAEEVAQGADIFTKTKLLSPQKQYLYLAGLLVSTEDLSSNTDIKHEDLMRSEEHTSELQSQR